MKLDCVAFDGEAEIQREGIDRGSRGKGEFNRVLARPNFFASNPPFFFHFECMPCSLK